MVPDSTGYCEIQQRVYHCIPQNRICTWTSTTTLVILVAHRLWFTHSETRQFSIENLGMFPSNYEDISFSSMTCHVRTLVQYSGHCPDHTVSKHLDTSRLHLVFLQRHFPGGQWDTPMSHKDVAQISNTSQKST